MEPDGCCQVLELRQYTHRPGRREDLLELFEREFVESQEALGMRVPGHFRDLDDPDRYVWLRGFDDMAARRVGLAAFYGGPVWAAHRDRANATLVDSDDVLLLTPSAGFAAPAGDRPAVGAPIPGTVIAATVYGLDRPAEDGFLGFFADRVEPLLGGERLALLRTLAVENTFPRLPVREGEEVVVRFARFSSDAGYAADRERLAASAEWAAVGADLRGQLVGEPRELRLRPAARSLLR